MPKATIYLFTQDNGDEGVIAVFPKDVPEDLIDRFEEDLSVIYGLQWRSVEADAEYIYEDYFQEDD